MPYGISLLYLSCYLFFFKCIYTNTILDRNEKPLGRKHEVRTVFFLFSSKQSDKKCTFICMTSVTIVQRIHLHMIGLTRDVGVQCSSTHLKIKTEACIIRQGEGGREGERGGAAALHRDPRYSQI